MSKEQIVMGVLIAVLSIAGLASERWLLARTRKGQALVRWFGPQGAVWALRAILTAFAVFGTLLACDVIRPIRW